VTSSALSHRTCREGPPDDRSPLHLPHHGSSMLKQSLDLSTRRTRKGVTITARGELDIATASELEAILDLALWEDTHVERVVLDLSELAFCDSSGLKVLVTAYRLSALTETAFEIVVAPGQVSDTIT